MENHQEQLAKKNADVNSAESLHKLSKETSGNTSKKSQKFSVISCT